jgi:hypothetical protein
MFSPSTRHVVARGRSVNGQYLYAGTVYFLDSDGQFHNDDAAAIETNYGKHWYFHGRFTGNNSIDYGESVPNWLPKDCQEHICRSRPHLISQIPNLYPELKVKYQHELELSRVDL